MKKINYYPDSRFPLNYISLAFAVKVKPSEISAFSLLAMMLIDSGKSLSGEREFALKLGALYGASISVFLRFYGETLVFFVTGHYLKKKLVKENLISSMVALIDEIVFGEKNFTCNFSYYHHQLLEQIEASDTHPNEYALKELLKKISPHSHLAFTNYGDKKSALNLKEDDVIKTYRKLLNAPYKIYLQGQYTKSDLKVISRLATNRKNDTKITLSSLKFKERPTLFKSRKINQTVLLSCYSFTPSFDSRQRLIVTLLNGMLGGLPSSKLFSIVREKHSLCYEISSLAIQNSGLLFIKAAVSKKTYTKAQNLIKEIVATLKTTITESELEETKAMVSASNRTLEDDPQRLFENRISRELNHQNVDLNIDLKTLEEITLEEIIDFAKTLKYRGEIVVKGEEND